MKYHESETVELKSIYNLIRKMIKDTDGDSYEDMRSLEQNLTFERASEEFEKRNIEFGEPQMRTPGIIASDGQYTNLGLLLSDQCPHIIKSEHLQAQIRATSKTDTNLQALCLSK